MFSENSYGIRAKVIGVGGAGISLVDGLRFDNFDSVDNLVIDVDMKAVSESLASEKFCFSKRHTRGMGTGGDIALGKRLAEEEKIRFASNWTVWIWSFSLRVLEEESEVELLQLWPGLPASTVP